MTESDGSPRKRDQHDKTRLAYTYLQELTVSGEPYSDAEMVAATGWSQSTVKTYRGKHWSDWISRDDQQLLRVSTSFSTVTLERFVEVHGQSTDFYSKYATRRLYGDVVTYEFLLPLTKERELKQALDDLFYSDTLERLIREQGLDVFKPQFPELGEADEHDGIRLVVQFVADHFGGYSISHVSGRFRAGEIVSRAQAGAMLAKASRYLVDETTAIVRFVVPLENSKGQYQSGEDFLGAVVVKNPSDGVTKAVGVELARVRRTFFLLFAEAVVKTVKGEDEVWLLESGPENRLYVWEKT